jgi:hypothetical protein
MRCRLNGTSFRFRCTLKECRNGNTVDSSRLFTQSIQSKPSGAPCRIQAEPGRCRMSVAGFGDCCAATGRRPKSLRCAAPLCAPLRRAMKNPHGIDRPIQAGQPLLKRCRGRSWPSVRECSHDGVFWARLFARSRPVRQHILAHVFFEALALRSFRPRADTACLFGKTVQIS